MVRKLMFQSALVISLLLFQSSPSATESIRPDSKDADSTAPSTYSLGPDDQIVIRAVDIDEIDNKPVRIDMRGNIELPLVGRLHAAGRTVEEVETDINTRLEKYVKDPSVSVYLLELRSQPVSVLGAVQTPGVHQLEGTKTLFEVLSLAGGLRSDAGNEVKITRHLAWGRIPLPNASDRGNFSVASVHVKSIMSAANPAENIIIKPNDVISVPQADIIYAIGAVHKSGGFVMGENETLTVLQVLSLAEGLDSTAASDSAKIMRVVDGTNNRAEIPVDLKKVLSGKAEDVPLKADDILFVPTSATKNAALRSLEAAVQIGTGIAIYHR